MISFIDIIIALILIWQAFAGYYKGFIFQITTLVALVAGIYGAYVFSGMVTNFMVSRYRYDESWVHIISFIIILIAIMLIVDFIGDRLDKAMKKHFVGITNKLLGILIAIVKTVFLLSIVIFVFNMINNSEEILPQKTIDQSIMYNPVSKVAPVVFPYIEKGIKNIKIDNQPIDSLIVPIT